MSYTIYVYENALLGEKGDQFDGTSCVDSITCDSMAECQAKFEADYDYNDYSFSYTRGMK